MSLSCISCRFLENVAWVDCSECSYRDNIAVFCFQLTDRSTDLTYLKSLLQPNECQRAERYYRSDDRKRFIYTRGFLRILASHYLNQAPEQVSFMAGANTKPMLTKNAGWHFNVSHSGSSILIAFADVSIGVDVEKLNSEFSFQDLLPVSFSKDEQEYINGGAAISHRFYQLWTRKEALLKATGKGIDDDFSQIPSLIGHHNVEGSLIGGTGNWVVNSFNAPSGYMAAVAYQATGEIPKFYTLNSVLFQH